MTAMAVRRSYLPALSAPRVGAWSGSLSIHLVVAALLLASPVAVRLIRHQVEQPQIVHIVPRDAPKPVQPVPAMPVPVHRLRVVDHVVPRVVVPTPMQFETAQSTPIHAAPVPVAAPVTPADSAPTALAYGASTRVAYPRDALRRHEQGTVLLRVLVGIDGGVRSATVERSSGSPRLDAAALDAVRHWRFRPATRAGIATSAWAQVPITFSLSNL